MTQKLSSSLWPRLFHNQHYTLQLSNYIFKIYSQVPNKRHVTLINYFKKIEPFCPYLGRDAYFLIQNLWGVTSIWGVTLIRISQKEKINNYTSALPLYLSISYYITMPSVGIPACQCSIIVPNIYSHFYLFHQMAWSVQYVCLKTLL